MPRKNKLDYNPNKVCVLEDCNEFVARRNWCRRHYRLWRLHGDPSFKVQIRHSGPEVRSEKACTKCARILSADKFKVRPNGRLESQCRECTNLRTRIKRYNLTEERYLEMLRSQDNKCAICHSENVNLFIDHDHSCCEFGSCGNCIRGLLCPACNSAIGALKESPEIFASALRYISG